MPLADAAPLLAPPAFFATPSPRLIPKGEEPDTFTGLALAPLEGCTEGCAMNEKGEAPAAASPGEAWLKRLCAQHEIPEEVERDLFIQAGYLRRFKDEFRPENKTPTKRARELERIAKLAAELRGLVEGLDFHDRAALDAEFSAVHQPDICQYEQELVDMEDRARRYDDDFPDLSKPWPGAHHFDVGGRVLPDIEKAADLARGRLTAVGKAGAQPLSARQADYIRCIATCLKPAGIKPSHDGLFLDICCAVHEAAGLTMPERALRYFMRNMRPHFRAAGYCL